MSLARAFTKRTRRPEVAPLPTREGSVRYAPGTISRYKISLPTELLSTTNVQALNAPDIRAVSTSSSNASLKSTDDSDFSHIDRSFIDSTATTPETSSIESSPVRTEHADHTSFFEAKGSTHSAPAPSLTRSTRSMSSTSSIDAPTIPQRALSHSKQAHQDLARQRSISRLTPPPSTLPASNVVRDSASFFHGSMDSSNPFGKELEQVNEVAEDFGGISSILDEEEQLLLSQGLCKFGVEEYINEIQGLYGGVYEGRLANRWI